MQEKTRRHFLSVFTAPILVSMSGCLEYFNTDGNVRYCGTHIANLSDNDKEVSIRLIDDDSVLFERELVIDATDDLTIHAHEQDNLEYNEGNFRFEGRINTGEWVEHSLTDAGSNPAVVIVFLSDGYISIDSFESGCDPIPNDP